MDALLQKADALLQKADALLSKADAEFKDRPPLLKEKKRYFSEKKAGICLSYAIEGIFSGKKKGLGLSYFPGNTLQKAFRREKRSNFNSIRRDFRQKKREIFISLLKDKEWQFFSKRKEKGKPVPFIFSTGKKKRKAGRKKEITMNKISCIGMYIFTIHPKIIKK